MNEDTFNKLNKQAENLKSFGMYKECKATYIKIIEGLMEVMKTNKNKELEAQIKVYLSKAEKVDQLSKQQNARINTEMVETHNDINIQELNEAENRVRKLTEELDIQDHLRDNNNLQANNKINNNQKKQKQKSESIKLNEYEEKIFDEIVDGKDLNVNFSDLFGLKHIEDKIYENIILPQKRPDLFDNIRQPVKGILLFGPPGNGKTMTAKAIAHECNRKFFAISAASITGKYVGDSEKSVRALFSVSNRFSPSIVFIDEIDSILTKRTSDENEASRKLKTEFLVQMDGVQGDSQQNNTLIIAATNRPSDLDDAVLRRFALRIYVDLPTPEAINNIIKHKVAKLKCELNEGELISLSKYLHGLLYSCSDVTNVVREASMMPFKDYTKEQLLSIKKEEIRGLILKDFIEASKQVRPSVNKDSLQYFLEYKKNFGC